MKMRILGLAVLLAAAWAVRAAPPSAPIEPRINFSFDQVDVRLLVKLVGDLTGRRFVVDKGVAGTVTVISPAPVPSSEVYPLFVSILEAHGYTVAEKEGLCYVMPLPERGVTGGRVIGPEGSVPAGGLVTRVIRVQYISALELRKILEPLVRGGKSGALAAFGPSNHLLVTDTADSVKQIERVVAELDRPGAGETAEFIPLEHASAEEVAAQLMTAMRSLSSSGATLSRHVQQVAEGGASLPAEVAVIPAASANGLVLVGAPVQIAELKRIVAMMDVEPVAGKGRLHAVFLKYLSADEAGKSLNALLAKTAEKDQRQRIAIEPNISNNALIVEASAQDFELVKALLAELDQVPQQVLVEVLIAEVALNKNLDLGVEWAIIESPKDGSTTPVSRSRPGDSDAVMDMITEGVFPQGLSVGVARGTYTDLAGNEVPNIPILIKALAQNRDVRILSNIPLWAQNNTEASLSVVENIPVLKSTIEGGSGTARDVIQNIDRMDVGIKLKLTPHVNPDREVLMQLNPSIEAIVDEGPEDKFAPTIAKREVSTTVTVPDRATVIISGLIREDEMKAVGKVPLLGDLPLVGWLFRSQSTRKVRTNLLIFVTPHVVTDVREAAAMKRDLERQAQLINAQTNLNQRPARRK
ncbi:MAG TPA: type II secretion system secretin GspD [Kiritimatiellia bacterium]|nr:type II secretion system secretin GspD [Kiritimatiellia bacterium]HRZ13018.1 type II secretion system secretin GspD [Kiritimatiellia bacterium]HSA18372.1 type II secretion system secretin GspD [Kiritimatiellia bacterium]